MKKFLILFVLFLSLASSANSQTPVPVINIPYTPTLKYRDGWEERGEKWSKWLSPSVMVTERGGGGSGTICYYDGEYAYIISCGHLYNTGRKSYAEYQKSPRYKDITVFYENGKQLGEYKKFRAETLCHVWNVPYDVSLLRFKPDWKDPWVAPIAPVDYQLEKDKFYHSTGCDGLTPTAHYLVRYRYENVEGRISEIITTGENGPRGGRSGGGVLTDDGQLIFICSRGSNNAAYWTSLLQIHTFLKEEGFSYILEHSKAKTIPIVDRLNPQQQYQQDFILLPKRY